MTASANTLAMAEAAAAIWGADPGSVRLIKMRENIVFQLQMADGVLAALRLHRPGYQSRATISAELDWTTRLANAGIRVPRPLLTRSGEATAQIGDRLASVVGWLDGDALGEAGVALSGTTAEQCQIFGELGRYLGDLHRLTDEMTFAPPPQRQRWDSDGFLGDDPLWGRFWQNPAFTRQEREMVLAARDLAAAQLAAMPEADFGLIHADVLRENILLTANGLALIDFDDCGYGFRLYDLGTAIVQNLAEPALPTMVHAMVDGYRQARPTADLTAADLVLFVALRSFASAGWIITRAQPDDPRQRHYAVIAATLARHLLEGTSSWALPDR